MKTSEKLIKAFRKSILSNKKYNLNPLKCQVKINQNESPFDLPKKIKKKIISRLGEKNWNIYPDFVPENLYKKIANFYNIDESNILIGNGSNEMIFTVLTATCTPGKKVIIPQPTFAIYELISSNLEADIKTIMLNDDFTFNIPEIIKEAKSEGSVTVLCSPNNPTGTYISYNDLKNIISSSGGIVVVDEAYIHFGGESVIDLINEYSNLIILRTFSKAFGLAGLRIGMMISNSETIKYLYNVKLPYNLNIFSLIALDEIFNNVDFVDKAVEKIVEEKNKLEVELNKIEQLKVVSSGTNFFLVKAKDSKFLFNKLLEFGILVRDVSSYPMLKNFLRITVGSKKENKLLVSALNKIYN